jgi:hypothetical protein
MQISTRGSAVIVGVFQARRSLVVLTEGDDLRSFGEGEKSS